MTVTLLMFTVPFCSSLNWRKTSPSVSGTIFGFCCDIIYASPLPSSKLEEKPYTPGTEGLPMLRRLDTARLRDTVTFAVELEFNLGGDITGLGMGVMSS